MLGIQSIFIAKVAFEGQSQSIKFGYYGTSHASAACNRLSKYAPTGICGLAMNAKENGFCSSSVTSNVDQVNTTVFGSGANDFTKGLIRYCQAMTSRILTPIFTAAAVSFLLGIIFLVLHEITFKRSLTQKGSPRAQSGRLKSVTMTLLLLSWAGCIASTASVAVTTHALDFTVRATQSRIKITPGGPLQILQWVTVGLSTLHLIGTNKVLVDSHKDPPWREASLEMMDVEHGGGSSAAAEYPVY